MTDYKLYCLGRPGLEIEGKPAKLEMRKALALLVYLRMADRDYSRESLATLFWPEYDQQHAQANLRRVLSSLKTTLPSELLATDRDKIGLKDDPKVWLDAYEFQQLVAFQVNHTHAQDQVCQECLLALEKAVRLYRGDFLEGFNLGDCPEFDEWQFIQRESLRHELGEALHLLSDGYASHSRWDQAIESARRRVALDRLYEPAQRRLISLYIQAGQRSAGLRQFEELVRILKAELGQEPEEETVDLYHKMRDSAIPAVKTEPYAFHSEVETPRMEEPLLKTKLYIPSSRGEKVHRERLIEKFNQIEEYALTIVSAPAGFGKTTALTEWIYQSSLPIGWVSLDSGDNDSLRFLTYVVSALKSIHPEIGAEIPELIHSFPPMSQQIILVNLIHELENVPSPFGLVLDDYQLIDAQPVHAAVEFLLDHMPANLHLVISTRSDPPLHIARLRASERLLEIRTNDLRFTPDEAHHYLNQVMGLALSSVDVAALEHHTEGWIVGLQMAGLSLQNRREVSSAIQQFSGSNRYILDYLVEEVLNILPGYIQSFLIQTSILERLCGPLCDAILGDKGVGDRRVGEQRSVSISLSPLPLSPILFSDSQSILEYLERANLFLVPLDDDRHWFRYHQLFTDLLRARLRQSEPARIKDLHARAAEWYENNGFMAEAIGHAFAVGNHERTALLIEKVPGDTVFSGKYSSLLGWLRALPLELVHQRPWSCVKYAWALLASGTTEGVDELIRYAELGLARMLEEAQGCLSSELQGLSDQILTVQVTIASLRENHPRTIELALRALAQIHPDEIPSRIHVYYALGNVYYITGDLSKAELAYQEARRLAEQSGLLLRTILSTYKLAHIQKVFGNLHQADHLYQELMGLVKKQGKEKSFCMGYIDLGLGELMYERNRTEEAMQMISEGARLNEMAGIPMILVDTYNILAGKLIARGDLKAAEGILQKATQFIQNYPTLPETRELTEACYVRLWLVKGDLESATKWSGDHQPGTNDAVSSSRELREMARSRVLIAQGALDEAACLLGQLAEAAEAGGRNGRLIEILILQALAQSAQNKTGEAMGFLERSLSLAEPEGYVRIFLDEGNPIKDLLQVALVQRPWGDSRIPKYIKSLLEAFDEQPIILSGSPL